MYYSNTRKRSVCTCTDISENNPMTHTARLRLAEKQASRCE